MTGGRTSAISPPMDIAESSGSPTTGSNSSLSKPFADTGNTGIRCNHRAVGWVDAQARTERLIRLRFDRGLSCHFDGNACRYADQKRRQPSTCHLSRSPVRWSHQPMLVPSSPFRVSLGSEDAFRPNVGSFPQTELSRNIAFHLSKRRT